MYRSDISDNSRLNRPQGDLVWLFAHHAVAGLAHLKPARISTARLRDTITTSIHKYMPNGPSLCYLIWPHRFGRDQNIPFQHEPPSIDTSMHSLFKEWTEGAGPVEPPLLALLSALSFTSHTGFQIRRARIYSLLSIMGNKPSTGKLGTANAIAGTFGNGKGRKTSSSLASVVATPQGASEVLERQRVQALTV